MGYLVNIRSSWPSTVHPLETKKAAININPAAESKLCHIVVVV